MTVKAVPAKRRDVRVERREEEGMKKKETLGAVVGEEKEKDAGSAPADEASLKRRENTAAQSGDRKSHQGSSVQSFIEIM